MSSYARAPHTGEATHFCGLVKSFTYKDIHQLSSPQSQGDSASFQVATACQSLKARLNTCHLADIASLEVFIVPRVCSSMLIVQAVVAFSPTLNVAPTRAMLLAMPNHAHLTFFLKGGVVSPQGLAYSEELSGAVPALKPAPIVTDPLCLLVHLEVAPADSDVELKTLLDKPVCDVILRGSITTGKDLVPNTQA